MILEREISVGHIPSIVFGIVIFACISVAVFFFLYIFKAPPTIFVPQALGTAIVSPAHHDVEYNEAIARRFLNLYGNYNHHNFRAKMWWASRMTIPEVSQIVMQNSQRVENNITMFSITRQTQILETKIEHDDPHNRRSVHSFRVVIREFYGIAEQDPITAHFLIEVSAVQASDGAEFSSLISKIGFFPPQPSK